MPSRLRFALLAVAAVLAAACVQPAATADLTGAGGETSASASPTLEPLPWQTAAPGPHTMEGEPGEQVASITVPRLGLEDFPMLMGTSDDILMGGVGVYTGAATPGSGNLATAGHRVTPVMGVWHGPYYDLDTLVEGDYAWVEFGGRSYEYAFVEVFVTTPDDTSVLADGVADLTMTACHPKGSARERIIAYWRLVGSAPLAA